MFLLVVRHEAHMASSWAIKVLWEQWGPVGLRLLAVVSIARVLSCGFPNRTSLRLGSLHFPQCLIPHQTPTSGKYPLSHFCFTPSLFSFLSQGKERGGYLVLREDSKGDPSLWSVNWPPQTCNRKVNVIYSQCRYSHTLSAWTLVMMFRGVHVWNWCKNV